MLHSCNCMKHEQITYEVVTVSHVARSCVSRQQCRHESQRKEERCEVDTVTACLALLPPLRASDFHVEKQHISLARRPRYKTCFHEYRSFDDGDTQHMNKNKTETQNHHAQSACIQRLLMPVPSVPYIQQSDIPEKSRCMCDGRVSSRRDEVTTHIDMVHADFRACLMTASSTAPSSSSWATSAYGQKRSSRGRDLRPVRTTAKTEEPETPSSEEDAMARIHAYFVALE